MVDQEQYVRYREDAKVLAAIGEHVEAQVGRVTVQLPKDVADAAVAAWERDEEGGRAAESHEEFIARDRAAELAFIGLAISERGRREGEDVVVDLDVASAGAALRASQWMGHGGRQSTAPAHALALPTGRPANVPATALGCPAMSVQVGPAGEADGELVEAFARLLPQLSGSVRPLDRETVAGLLACSANTVLLARLEGRIVGMLTLVLLPLPSGLRARIEDVVVDAGARGHGVGAALTAEAVRLAGEAGARTVDLTSRPSRGAANRLYERAGFEVRGSVVYRRVLESS
ncbi:GNAT family N-acetyltransferase [Kitasatospora sp. NPDC051853]|uniref:GNAT family N-acetyltransferase n=1 Tax=Kitasatospora sp. NPDC051853 TaxID=3364058 RepID=UPI0037BB317A